VVRLQIYRYPGDLTGIITCYAWLQKLGSYERIAQKSGYVDGNQGTPAHLRPAGRRHEALVNASPRKTAGPDWVVVNLVLCAVI
jgi:hypothetical protein